MPATKCGMITGDELAAVAVLRRRGGGAARHARGRATPHLTAAAEPPDPGTRGRARPAAVRAPRPRHRAHRVRPLLRDEGDRDPRPRRERARRHQALAELARYVPSRTQLLRNEAARPPADRRQISANVSRSAA